MCGNETHTPISMRHAGPGDQPGSKGSRRVWRWGKLAASIPGGGKHHCGKSSPVACQATRILCCGDEDTCKGTHRGCDGMSKRADHNGNPTGLWGCPDRTDRNSWCHEPMPQSMTDRGEPRKHWKLCIQDLVIKLKGQSGLGQTLPWTWGD